MLVSFAASFIIVWQTPCQTVKNFVCQSAQRAPISQARNGKGACEVKDDDDTCILLRVCCDWKSYSKENTNNAGYFKSGAIKLCESYQSCLQAWVFRCKSRSFF